MLSFEYLGRLLEVLFCLLIVLFKRQSSKLLKERPFLHFILRGGERSFTITDCLGIVMQLGMAEAEE